MALAESEKAVAAEVCKNPMKYSLDPSISSNIYSFFSLGEPLQGSKVPVKDTSCLSVSGVYFTCPLTGATLTKSDREARIKEAILMVGLQTCCHIIS